MIYDELYKEDDYNPAEPYKLRLVKHWLEEVNPHKILDMGCGRGHYIDYLYFPVTGVEPSKTLCEVHPWINATIVEFAKKNKKKWDALYCMDVLEHIEPNKIEENIKALSILAPNALIGIANHSDVQKGVELHLIQKPSEWWEEKLKKAYKTVIKTYEPDRYMVFECYQ